MSDTALTEPPATAQPATRLRLSFSRVDTYLTCPLKFRFAYVERLPQQPSPSLSWGSSVHAALEAWWDRKLPQPPPVEDLLQALYDGWDDSGFAGMPREEKLRWYAHAQDVLRRHHARYAPVYVPAVACEQWFELDLGGGVEVVGSIDHVARTPAGGIGIVDWKTNRKAKPRERVRGSLQLAIYCLAARELWGHEPEWVALDFVVPGVRVRVDRADIDVEGALATLRDVGARILAATAFAPRPSRLCPWCDYRTLCPAFDGEGPDVAGLAVAELERLRRRQARDAARITELESLIRDRLGPGALVEVG
ncbi:MAG TPA: PD-(D/E)XK nuclease family protein [Egibacteraceae bacterium]|nr:PD-(D/E)XK nuclease family protein [Egibacteraceae bacterium]